MWPERRLIDTLIRARVLNEAQITRQDDVQTTGSIVSFIDELRHRLSVSRGYLRPTKIVASTTLLVHPFLTWGLVPEVRSAILRGTGNVWRSCEILFAFCIYVYIYVR